jgi:hypothetical protein
MEYTVDRHLDMDDGTRRSGTLIGAGVEVGGTGLGEDGTLSRVEQVACSQDSSPDRMGEPTPKPPTVMVLMSIAVAPVLTLCIPPAS